MASQSLQLIEGISKVRLRRGLIAVPDLFKACRELRKRLLPSGKSFRFDKFRFNERAQVFARGLCPVGRESADVLQSRNARPIGAMNGHAIIAAPGRFARREDPLLPRS